MAVFNMQRPSVPTQKKHNEAGYGAKTRPQRPSIPSPGWGGITATAPKPIGHTQPLPGSGTTAPAPKPIGHPQPLPGPITRPAPPPIPNPQPFPMGGAYRQTTQPTGPRLGGGAMPFRPQSIQPTGPRLGGSVMPFQPPQQSIQPTGQRLGGSAQMGGSLADALSRRQGMNPQQNSDSLSILMQMLR